MQLPNELRQRLIAEYRYAADQMQATEDPHQQLYYLSVYFGEASRVLNWHWDRDLVLLHSVVTTAQQTISNALTNVTKGERVVRLTPAFMQALTQAAKSLADWVEQNGTKEQFLDILGRFAELTYATTGNGYYLMGKGIIQIPR